MNSLLPEDQPRSKEYRFGTVVADHHLNDLTLTVPLRAQGIRHMYFLFGVITAVISIALLVSLLVTYLAFNKNTATTSGSSSINRPATANSWGNVTVYYASSFNDLMTRIINPDFSAKYDYSVMSVSAASGVLATSLKAGAVADVFISAASSYDTTLLSSLLIPSGKPVIRWYASFAKSRLGIGYNTQSPFLSVFQAIASGALPWYEGLDTTKYSMKIGRTDPNIDPKGYRTVIMTRLAEIFYNRKNISTTVLGTPRNNLQIYTEQNLEKLLQNGDLDVGFFYECEYPWNGNLRFISLPAQLDFSNSSYNSYYSKANYTNTATGAVTKGSAIVYTITIPTLSPDPPMAAAYVSHLLSLLGTAQMTQEGLLPLASGPIFAGNLSAVPTLAH